MKKLLYILLLFINVTAYTQSSTNTRQIRFFSIITASDTSAVIANSGRMWYDSSTDEFRVNIDGVNYSLRSTASASGGGPLTINEQTASYELELVDGTNSLVRMDVAGANDLTVPANATIAFPLGTTITIEQTGVGLTTVVAAGGVTINGSAGNLLSPGQGSPMVLVKVATNEWDLWNGTEPAVGLAAGNDTEIQYNDAGVLGASPLFIFDPALLGDALMIGDAGGERITLGYLNFNMYDVFDGRTLNINSSGWDAGSDVSLTSTGSILINPDGKLMLSVIGADDNLILETGNGVRTLMINGGANEQCGTAVLVGGTVTVNNTKVSANSIIIITVQALGTVAVPSGYSISARVAGTSFTILASAPTDTSTVGWFIIEPN